MQIQETYSVTGPQLDVLGRAEQKMPAPLKRRGLAVFLAVVLALGAVFGLGGAKLNGQYRAVTASYTAADEYGNGIVSDLAAYADAAANIISVGRQILDAQDPQLTAAVQALEAFNAASTDHPAQQCAACSDLGAAVDALYQTLAATPMEQARASSLQTQRSEMLSRRDILEREAANGYNLAAQQYNQMAESFPASVIGAVWGCGKVELFQ